MSVAVHVRWLLLVVPFHEYRASTQDIAARQASGSIPQEKDELTATSFKEEDAIWMTDRAAPKAVHAKTHYLNSVPSTFRFPWIDRNNASSYFRRVANETKTFVWEYNPSIVHLPADQVPDIAQLRDPRIQKDSLYLAVYRVSSVHACLDPDFLLEHNLTLGGKGPLQMAVFAILDAELNILAEASVKHGEDNRLYNFRGQLYLGRKTLIWPIWINRNATPSNIPTLTLRSRLSRGHFSVHQGIHASCATSLYRQGKNFNYFEDSSGRLMVQIYPMGPRIVEKVNVSAVCKTIHQTSLNENSSMDQLASGSLFMTQSLPKASFRSFDEAYFHQHGKAYPFMEERGSACCISLPDQRDVERKSSQLLVGISHTKVPFSVSKYLPNASFTSRQYTSRLYAFEPVPPYRVVARSGGFCLGFPDHDEGLDNPNLWLVRNHSYTVGRPLNCPYITFVMSIVDAVDDPSMAIITYGMNDCASRMIKVLKTDLSQILFPQQQGELLDDNDNPRP